jgi:uncharacterized membrane protein YccC
MRGKRKPRQRHIVALGGIAETDARTDVAACHAFWTKALQRLAVRNLSRADRQKIEAALAAGVKRPTEEQVKQQQLQDLRHSLQLAQQRVQEIKLEMRSVRDAE